MYDKTLIAHLLPPEMIIKNFIHGDPDCNYEKYLLEREEYIKEKCEKIRAYEEDRYKSAEAYSKFNKESTELWNRNSSHADYLKYKYKNRGENL